MCDVTGAQKRMRRLTPPLLARGSVVVIMPVATVSPTLSYGVKGKVDGSTIYMSRCLLVTMNIHIICEYCDFCATLNVDCLSVLLFAQISYKSIPVQALRIPGGWSYHISRQSVHKGGKIVSRKHRPPLPHLLISVSVSLDPRAIVRPEGLSQWQISMTPQPSGL